MRDVREPDLDANGRDPVAPRNIKFRINLGEIHQAVSSGYIVFTIFIENSCELIFPAYSCPTNGQTRLNSIAKELNEAVIFKESSREKIIELDYTVGWSRRETFVPNVRYCDCHRLHLDELF